MSRLPVSLHGAKIGSPKGWEGAVPEAVKRSYLKRETAQARGGVDQNYTKELDANRTVYTSQVDAAGLIRD